MRGEMESGWWSMVAMYPMRRRLNIVPGIYVFTIPKVHDERAGDREEYSLAWICLRYKLERLDGAPSFARELQFLPR